VSDRAYRRLTRYAAFATVHGLAVLAVVLGAGGEFAGLVVLAVSLPLVWAWGQYQADVQLNPLLDDGGRNLWRVAIWCVPWSMPLYWQRHVRPRRLD
jgi:hypothetical protein